MVNSRAKCLDVNQVLKVKSYNNYLIFVSYKVFLLLCDTMSYFLFLTLPRTLYIWAHRCLWFHTKLSARTRVNLSSLSPPLLHISKLLASLTLSPLLYLLSCTQICDACGCARGFWVAHMETKHFQWHTRENCQWHTANWLLYWWDETDRMLIVVSLAYFFRIKLHERPCRPGNKGAW